jgi:hypothetical protein
MQKSAFSMGAALAYARNEDSKSRNVSAVTRLLQK